MYYLKEWSKDLDLNEFYLECAEKGFSNNSSQKRLIGSFQKYPEWNAWILYNDSTPIGSVAAHSFDDVMGPNTYRILARTCVLQGVRSKGLMVAKAAIKQHQNFTNQFFVPACIKWSGNNRVFGTSNSDPSTDVGTQRLVHKYYFPALQEIGLVGKIDTVYYKNSYQTVWEIFKEPFLEHLNQFPRWT